jgi:hypothetical protein
MRSRSFDVKMLEHRICRLNGPVSLPSNDQVERRRRSRARWRVVTGHLFNKKVQDKRAEKNLDHGLSVRLTTRLSGRGTWPYSVALYSYPVRSNR